MERVFGTEPFSNETKIALIGLKNSIKNVAKYVLKNEQQRKDDRFDSFSSPEQNEISVQSAVADQTGTNLILLNDC